MLRFTIRDVLWLMVVVGMALGWWAEHQQTTLARLAWRQRSRINVAEALAQTTTVDFVETPLLDVAEYFSSIHGIPVVLAAGVDGTKPITCKMGNVVLRDALKKVLSVHSLSFREKEGGLFIEQKP